MKTSFYLLLSTLISQTMFGQTTYEPIFINQCNNKIVNGVSWYLTDSTTTYGMENIELRSVELPKVGFYKLHFNDVSPITIEITHNKINRDTIFLKRLELVIYISNPPHSEYLDCGKLANREVLDFYSNGNLRTRGVFKEGQPIDTIFEYHRNNKLSELFIPRKKWKRINYFDNGNLKSVYDTKKRCKKEYYHNGQLKKEEYWNRKHVLNSTEYNEKGNIIKITNKKEQKKFNDRGVIIEKIHRKEILLFDRIFAKNKYDRNNKFYEYVWNTFDDNGKIKRKIIFNSHGFSMNPFPNSLKQIKYFSFEKVLLYKDGIESKKIEFRYDHENKNTIRKMIIFRKEDNKWTEEKTTTANNVYNLLWLSF